MYSEDKFIQVSALQHFVFCQRQCALIHIEQAWSENIYTAEGRIMHENVHKEHTKNITGVRIVSGMLLHSFELGLSGKADIVEFHKKDNHTKWIPLPVEYKRGKPKSNNSDKIQLCAQALCLEEMIKISIPEGSLFYGKTRHRVNVLFDVALREETKNIIRKVHIFIEEGKTPLPEYSQKCKSCSFIDECLPKIIGKKISIEKYLSYQIENQ